MNHSGVKQKSILPPSLTAHIPPRHGFQQVRQLEASSPLPSGGPSASLWGPHLMLTRPTRALPHLRTPVLSLQPRQRRVLVLSPGSIRRC